MTYKSLFKKLFLTILLCRAAVGEPVLAAKDLDITLFLSSPPPGSILFYLRSVEWREPVTNTPFSVCADNKDPATDYCYIRVACTPSAGNESTYAFIKGFRLTDTDFRQAFLALAGSPLDSDTIGFCLGRDKSGKPILKKNPFIQVNSYTMNDRGFLKENNLVHFLKQAELEVPEEDARCKVTNKNLEINFGNILINEANGSERTVNLSISCTGSNGYAQLSIPGYTASGIKLRADNSLQAKINIGDGKTPAENISTYRIVANTTRDIPISVKLNALPDVKGGEFNASTVIHINYI